MHFACARRPHLPDLVFKIEGVTMRDLIQLDLGHFNGGAIECVSMGKQ